MSILRQKMIDELSLFGFSPYTKRNYVEAVVQLTKFYQKSPLKIGEEEIKRFLLHEQKRGLARSTLRIITNAIRFFYQNVVQQPKSVENVPSIKAPKKLPDVLSMEEVKTLIQLTKNVKHKTILMLLYSTGMRTHELVQLKNQDIDGQRMTVKIMGKGQRQRYLGLSPIMLDQLREYWRIYRPTHLLFTSWKKSVPYSTRSIQRTLHRAKELAGIHKTGGPHLLRHSYATHLYESGVSLPVLQRLLGHRSIKTTSLYIFVAKETVTSVKSLLDMIQLPKEKTHV